VGFEVRVEVYDARFMVLGQTVRTDGELLLSPINIVPFEAQHLIATTAAIAHQFNVIEKRLPILQLLQSRSTAA
jgi:hypothetical protein